MECTKRGRYIDVNYHYVRREFLRNKIDLFYVRSEENLADIMTKLMPENKFETMAKRIVN